MWKRNEGRSKRETQRRGKEGMGSLHMSRKGMREGERKKKVEEERRKERKEDGKKRKKRRNPICS